MARKAPSFAWLALSTLLFAACGDDAGSGSSENPNEPSPPAAGNEGAAGAAGTKAGNIAGGGSTAGKGGDAGKPGNAAGSPAAPPKGATDFSSADPNNNQSGSRAGGPTTAPGATGSAGSASAAPPSAMSPPDSANGGAPRTVERGDIYRVLGDKRILNLNAYRGLQVIDVSNVDAPRLEGRYAVSGTPLEMYTVGDRAIVLLNNWRGYYGSREDVKVEAVEGGVILNIDISNRAAPKLLSQAVMKGSISTSRLTQGGDRVALYVAGTVQQNTPPYGSTTLVKSFDVSGNDIAEKSQIDLGGYVRDIQATAADYLLVSSNDYTKQQQNSSVAVIDISNPDGTMVLGASVPVRGIVENKFNMDYYNGVLRVVSGASWSGTRENHLETFSLADPKQPRPLDHCTFGNSSETLFATIFIENKGFFVTYFRQDPFHAFSIDDQGRCEEHTEFIVSGWNDFLRPTLGNTRLVGIGTNDAAMRRTVSVSLYDTTNIDNPNPLVARADLSIDNSYSEAQWDDRAFSVLENAVSVAGPNEYAETGLILVPFQGYDAAKQEYRAQVQILTFSDRSLTRRGVMDHGSSVRRSFLAEPNIAANLSEEELRLFEISNPNAPQSRGRVEVAPNYRQMFVYGDHVARIHDPNMYFGWYGNPNVTPPPVEVEIIPRGSDLDTTSPVAEFEVDSRAMLTQVGKLLVAVRTDYNAPVKPGEQQPNGTFTEAVYKSTIQVFDLSDPTKPAARGMLETDRIRGGYYGAYPPGLIGPAIADCFNCRWGGRPQPQNHVVGDAIVYAQTRGEQQSIGVVNRCYEYPTNGGCAGGFNPNGTCAKYIQGSRTCVTPKGGKESCSGSFFECAADTGECSEISLDDIALSRNCVQQEEFRYWQVYTLDALDLRNPDEPKFADALAMDKSEEGTSLLTAGTALYYNFQKPNGVDKDSRSIVKRFFKRIDFADPQSPSVGKAVNVPGDVIAADGGTVYTRDLVWEEQNTRTLVARLIVEDDLAYLQASRVFGGRTVSKVELDGAGHILVSSDEVYSGYVRPVAPGSTGSTDPTHTLSILDAETLELSGETDVDSWATFVDAVGGKALFSVSGGLLVINVEDAAKPVAQAYFPTLSWPSDIYFDGQEAIFAGGPYGMYRFDTNIFNLLMK